MSVIIEGSSTNLATIISSSIMKIFPSNLNGSGNPSNPGNYITKVFEHSNKQYQSLSTSKYNEVLSPVTNLFYDNFNHTINTATGPSPFNWFTLSMTTANNISTPGFTGTNMIINRVLSVSKNNNNYLRSIKTFPLFTGFPLEFNTTQSIISSIPLFYHLYKFGIFSSSDGLSTYGYTQGIYFVMKNNYLYGCVNFSDQLQDGEQYSEPITMPTFNTYHAYKILINNTFAEFFVDNILKATVTIPSGLGAITRLNALPVSYYNKILTTTNFPISMSLKNVSVNTYDSHLYAINYNVKSLFCFDVSDSATGFTHNYVFNSVPSAGAGSVSNTTTAYISNLGGVTSCSSLGSVGTTTDCILTSFGFVNDTSLRQKCGDSTFYITSIVIDALINSADATVEILFFSLAIGGTAVSLATTESATTKEYRRIPLGILTSSSAPITLDRCRGGPLIKYFKSPLCVCVAQREHANVVCKSNAYVSGNTYAFTIQINGFWE